MAKVKGICKNIDNCDMAERKEIQEVEKSASFVCQECGKQLVPTGTTPPPGSSPLLWIIIAAIVLAAGGGGGYYYYSSTTGEAPIEPDTTVIVDVTATNIATLSAGLKEGHLINNNNGSGSISTPSGKYEGELKDGEAHGNGTFQFFKPCRISSRDSQERMAETGDYLVGQFASNEVVNAKWFDKDKKQKGTIIIGQAGI